MPNEQQGSEPMSEATYYRGEWSSVVGVGVFRKRSDQPNDMLIVAIPMPKDEAITLADQIVNLLRSAPAALTDNEYLSAERIRLAKEQVDYELGKGKPEPQPRTEGSGQIGAPNEAAVARARECVSKIMALADNLSNHRRVEAMINIIAAFSASEHERLEGELAKAVGANRGMVVKLGIAESELTALRLERENAPYGKLEKENNRLEGELASRNAMYEGMLERADELHESELTTLRGIVVGMQSLLARMIPLVYNAPDGNKVRADAQAALFSSNSLSASIAQEHDREVAAKVLREAAIAWEHKMISSCDPSPNNPAQWLRARAQAITKQATITNKEEV